MTDTSTIYILGANDPEMEQIEGLLKALQMPYGYAICNGERVHSGNAYKATDAKIIDVPTTSISVVTLIECDIPYPPFDTESLSFEFIDHHRSGDVGYDMPPPLFLNGSSIGQLILDLCQRLTWEQIKVAKAGFQVVDSHTEGLSGTFTLYHNDWATPVIDQNGFRHLVSIPEKYIYSAASDHCPLAAYQGECIGVDPKKLMDIRLQHKAEYKGIDLETLIEVVNDSLMFIHDHHQGQFLDLVELGCDTIPEGPEASLRANVTLLSKVRVKGGGQKLVLLNGSFEHICEWMEQQLAKGREVYGNPHRGYAGAYLT